MRNPEVTKNTILSSSGELFNTQGYKATSISHITDATGLTKGAIYKHFENKDDLEIKTLEYLSEEMFRKMRAIIRNEDNAVAKLKSVFRFFASYITHPPLIGGCPLLNVAIESDDTNQELREVALRMLNVLKQGIVTVIRNGIRFGQIKPDSDPEQYATLIIASLEGAIMMGKLTGKDDDINIVINHLETQIEQIRL